MVTVQGTINAEVSGRTDISNLAPGSYFGSRGEAVHKISCESGDDCILYIHAEGKYTVVPL